jgi:hypothetical protein
VGDWFSLQYESSRAFCVPRSFHSWEDSLTIRFCQCLTLGRVDEHIHIARILQLVMLVISSKDIITALHQLHIIPLDLVLSHIFYY